MAHSGIPDPVNVYSLRHWKLPFIVDLPMNSMVIFHSYVSLPEGIVHVVYYLNPNHHSNEVAVRCWSQNSRGLIITLLIEIAKNHTLGTSKMGLWGQSPKIVAMENPIVHRTISPKNCLGQVIQNPSQVMLNLLNHMKSYQIPVSVLLNAPNFCCLNHVESRLLGSMLIIIDSTRCPWTVGPWSFVALSGHVWSVLSDHGFWRSNWPNAFARLQEISSTPWVLAKLAPEHTCQS